MDPNHVRRLTAGNGLEHIGGVSDVVEATTDATKPAPGTWRW